MQFHQEYNISMKNIIGRKEECERLDECMESNNSQLIIVYGRRRVGKTYLINEYFNYEFAYKLTGAYGVKKELQLRTFINELNRKVDTKYDVPKDWIDAFDRLRDYLDSLSTDKKHVIFFDEMPWLDTKKSGFLEAFEWFWNGYASTKKNLICIVCGSATSWMDDKIANNKGGLFNRQTCKLYLKPFKLYEVKEYLESRNIHWSLYDIACTYMILGGIPYYLSLLKSKLSYNQNIDNLFFKENGELFDEFDHLYKTLFTNSENYIKVVEALNSKRSGLNRKEISNKTKIEENGTLTKILKNLELSGFIKSSNFYKNKKKETVYQLSDYYTAFYLKFIKDNYGKDEHYWINSIDDPSRRTWFGLTFENVCRDHISQIKHKLGISGVLSNEYVWNNGEAQIDLLIERRDMVINLCEIKFSVNEFEIDSKYDMEIRNKMEAFRKAVNYKKSIQIIMITTYGLKKSKYNSLITNEVTLDDLFHI